MGSALHATLASPVSSSEAERPAPAATDAALGVRDGDEAADPSEVFQQHFSLVWRALRRLGAFESLLDDATQDVFLVVHRRWQEFEGRSQLRTWLLGIALRVAADYRKKQRKQAERWCDEEAPSVAEPLDPERAYASRQAGELLYRLLGDLRPIEREVLVLVDLEQTSVSEAALVLGVNVNTAYSRLRVARQRFEARMARYRKSEGETL